MAWFQKPISKPPTSMLCGVRDDVPFQGRVAQTIAWCQARLDQGAVIASATLRSDRLRPKILDTDRAAIVRDVAHQRAVDPAVRATTPVKSVADLHGGRLLAYFPDLEVADGAAEVETNGFFDINDTPPWDTWVGLFSDPELTGEGPRAVYLVSWVPADLVGLVQKGLDVSVTDCIAWLENTATGLAQYLQKQGFDAAQRS
jgi:hypothetical protein